MSLVMISITFGGGGVLNLFLKRFAPLFNIFGGFSSPDYGAVVFAAGPCGRDHALPRPSALTQASHRL